MVRNGRDDSLQTRRPEVDAHLVRPHFALFGFPVHVGTSAVVFIGLSYLVAGASGLTLIGAFMGSILLHELGHAFAFRHYGCRSSITLHGFGGMTVSYDAHGLTHKQHIVVSLAGPLSQLFLLGLPMLSVLLLADVPPGATTVLALLVFVNIGWALVNLLPLYPLDGGHVLYRTLAHRRVRRAWPITVGVTLAVAVPAMALAVANGQRLAVLIIGYAVWQGLSGREPVTMSNPIRDAAARARQQHRPMKTRGRQGDELVEEAYARIAEGNERRIAVILEALEPNGKRADDVTAIRAWKATVEGAPTPDGNDDLLAAITADPIAPEDVAPLLLTAIDSPRLPAAVAALTNRDHLDVVLEHVTTESDLQRLEDRLLHAGLATAQMRVAREIRLRAESSELS